MFLGIVIGIIIYQPFEWLFINYVYFRHLDLFNDIVLTEKNRKKLKLYYGVKE